MKATYTLLLFFYLILLVACANQVAPTGGPKDKTPPRVGEASPPNQSTNFSTDNKIISLDFDEYIKLKDVKNQVLISPFIKNTPKFKVKGKSLIIEFEDELLPNTTYSINFGKSILDITEGNAMPVFGYAFSTGDQLDTLKIKGKVFDAASNKKMEGVIVALYPPSPDSLVTTTTPSYIARTEEDGKYKINNIKAGKYRLIALKDQNRNYFFDQANEDIGFVSSLIEVGDTAKQNNDLRLFNEGKERIKILEKNNREYGHIELLFSKRQDSLAVLDFEEKLDPAYTLVEKSKNNDTIQVWYKKVQPESIKYILKGSTNYLDTVVFKKLFTKLDDLQDLRYLTSINTTRMSKKMDVNQPLIFKFTHPIQSVDVSKIELTADSVRIDLTGLVRQSDKNKRHLIIDYKAWKPETNYLIYLPDSTVVDYFGRGNDEIDIGFQALEERDYATMILKCEGFQESEQYVLELWTKNDVLKKTVVLEAAETTLQYLKAGKYDIRIIKDANKNGKWDTGDWTTKKQAEAVISSAKTIELKSNWDTEVKIDLEK